MSVQDSSDHSIAGEDDLHRFVRQFRPILISINIVFCLLFVGLRVWTLIVLFMAIALMHYCMLRWDDRHGKQFALMTPWLWWVYLGSFLRLGSWSVPLPGFSIT